MTFSCLTKEEVRYKYRKADNKEMMVQILADLTCSSVKEMLEFLGENITTTKGETSLEKRCFDRNLAKKYYDAGMTDGQIARKMGTPRSTISWWRRGVGLVSNYYKKQTGG